MQYIDLIFILLTYSMRTELDWFLIMGPLV